MNVTPYFTPERRLYKETCLVIQAMRESNLSRGSAEARLFATIAEDPDLLLQLVGKERMMQFVSEHITEVEQRDFDGGGIGLCPVTKTGGDAVADEAGHCETDVHMGCAPSSAPQSQTPAEKPVGGGQTHGDSHAIHASPTTHTTVREHPRRLKSAPIDAPRPAAAWSPSNIAPTTKAEPKPKAPYVAPKERVSAQAQLRTKNLVASSILDTTIIRGKPLGKWKKGEALALSERMHWDCIVIDNFCKPMPSEEMAIEDFYTVREAEILMKKLEANRAA